MSYVRKAELTEITSDDVFVSPKWLTDMGYVTGGGSPSGSDGYIQFKTTTSFDSDSNLYFDKTLKYFQVGTTNTQVSSEAFLNLVKNDNSFRSIGVQNLNAGNLACGDFTSYRNDATLTTNFASFGINSSTYSDPLYPIQSAGSGYSFVNGGNFVIGTQTAHDVIFHTGGTALTDRSMIISGSIGQKGYVGFLEGTNSAPTLLGKVHIVNETDGVGTFFADRYSATQSALLTLRRARGTVALPTAILLNDSLGGIGFRGYGATAFSSGTRVNILPRAIQNWTDTAQGTLVDISTTPIGTTTSVVSLSIANTGLTTASTTYSVINTTATTLSAFGSATTLTIGGTPTTSVTHNYSTNNTTNGNTKTINIGTNGNNGSITNINLGSASGGALGTTTFGSVSLVSSQTTLSLFDTVSTTVNAFNSATTLNIGNTNTGTKTMTLFDGATVNGATKTINIGTGGVAGSITNIILGSSVAGQLGTLTLHSDTTIPNDHYLTGRIRPRVGTTTSSATPTINTDTVDYYSLTAQSVAITSFTTNLTGTPTNGQKLWISITGTGAIAITWGASFEASTIPLPTTTVSTNRLDAGFIWNSITSKWRCIGAV